MYVSAAILELPGPTFYIIKTEVDLSVELGVGWVNLIFQRSEGEKSRSWAVSFHSKHQLLEAGVWSLSAANMDTTGWLLYIFYLALECD